MPYTLKKDSKSYTLLLEATFEQELIAIIENLKANNSNSRDISTIVDSLVYSLYLNYIKRDYNNFL